MICVTANHHFKLATWTTEGEGYRLLFSVYNYFWYIIYMYSKKVKTPSDFLLLSNELENIRDFSGLAVLLGVNQDYLLMNILPSYTCFEIKKKSTLRKVYYPEYYVSEIQRTLNLYLTASYLTNYYLPTQLPVHSYIPRITLTEQSDSDICRNNKQVKCW